MLMSNTEKPLKSSCLRAVFFVAICVFILILTKTTDSLYSHTADHRVLVPAKIIAGESQAPNQYRILTPLLYKALDSKLIHNPELSDRIVIFLSILACYVAAGALFYRSSRSMTTTLLGLLALLGCFSFGMIWKYRQEFFEVALVSTALLTVISVRKIRLMYLLLMLMVLLGSLNRETYVFCITAIATHIIYHRVIGNREKVSKHITGIAVLFAAFAVCYIAPRWYYGLSHYHCPFWTYEGNLENLKAFFTSSYNLGHLGAGLLFAYIATTTQGNRRYLAFIAGYAVPMFFVSSFISLFSEHRVFYPLMTLLLASMLGFSAEKKQAEAIESHH